MIDLKLTCDRRETPNVRDVFECAYDVMLGNEFLGSYYKLVDGRGYTASTLSGDTYVSPGACIVSIIREATLGVTRYMEREINLQIDMSDACYECSKHTSGECFDCQTGV